MQENIGLAISLLALLISVLSYTTAKKSMKRASKWQEEDIQIRKNLEKQKKLAPYIDLVHKTYCDFEELFSDYSRVANQFYNRIVDLADTYNNSNGTNNHALRHHMAYACDNIIEENRDDILFQHPEYLFNNLLNRKYRKLDYKLDLQKNDDLNTVEKHLKILNENIDPSKKHLYLDDLIKLAPSVYQIYYDNKEKIDKSIKQLENEMKKYKYYDFDNTINDFYLEFKGLLNLLRYIKEVSTTYTNEFDKDFTTLTLSEIVYKITSIMIVNEGVLKISKY